MKGALRSALIATGVVLLLAIVLIVVAAIFHFLLEVTNRTTI